MTLSTTDIGKSYPSCKIFWSQVCLLTLCAKIKFSQKFPDYSMDRDQTAPNGAV